MISNMKIKPLQARRYLRIHVLLWAVVIAGISGLLLYRLGTLTGGMSAGELATATAPVGWHGVYHQPFYLPLQMVRSVVFFVFPEHGQLLTRLPNAFFGGMAILSFAAVVRIWHGKRIALLATALFASSAWVLHSSRWASFDVLYVWAIPTLWLVQLSLKKRSHTAIVWYGSLLVWGLLLYVPGLVWFVLASVYFQRSAILSGWRHFARGWQRALYIITGLGWLPLLIVHLTRPGTVLTWLGLPTHLAPPLDIARQFLLIPYHLFVHGPASPELWLGRLPIFDVFALAMCIVGAYFYIRHLRAARTRLLACYGVIATVLIGLGGPVSLSLLVPLLYLAAATGLASLLHQWFTVFPRNPLARSVGVGLLALAVAMSGLYNLRLYFVAWPHNHSTKAIFQEHRKL